MKHIKVIFIILINTLLLLCLIEVALQVFYPTKIKLIPFIHNKDYYISLKPNIVKQFRQNASNEGDTINWQVNSDSFRGPDLRKSEFRIIVYGDSSAYKDSLQLYGASLAVLIQSSTFDLTNNVKFNANDMYALSTSYNPKNLCSSIESSCNILSIPMYNLFDDFVLNNSNDLYFKEGDNYWNDKGQDLAAKKMSNILLPYIFSSIKNDLYGKYLIRNV